MAKQDILFCVVEPNKNMFCASKTVPKKKNIALHWESIQITYYKIPGLLLTTLGQVTILWICGEYWGLEYPQVRLFSNLCLSLRTPANCNSLGAAFYWAAVKELNFSCGTGGTISFTICTHYGNLNPKPYIPPIPYIPIMAIQCESLNSNPV